MPLSAMKDESVLMTFPLSSKAWNATFSVFMSTFMSLSMKLTAVFGGTVALRRSVTTSVFAARLLTAIRAMTAIRTAFLKVGDVKIELLTSKTPKKEKDKILKSLALGETDIIIGTHSLIEDNVKFKDLKLIVIDEQHRFGVKQRAKLRAKARDIDMLSMTATPIPRTFALAFYGDLDVSTIDQLPPGRQPVDTAHLSEGRAFDMLKEEVSKGRQAYIVYPLIDESDKLQLKAATQEFERIKTLMPQYKVAMIHGAMKSTEKQKIMEDFLSRKTDILVATPVIEVGIDVKNATVMVIQNAERFGLASLHQLRGRVGRGSDKSYCILVTQNTSGIEGTWRNTRHQTIWRTGV